MQQVREELRGRHASLINRVSETKRKQAECMQEMSGEPVE